MTMDFTVEEKRQLQHDILIEKTSDNPLFTSHSVDSINKALKTTDKRIVGAINELKKSNEQTLNVVNDNLNTFLDVIGNYNTDTSLKDSLLAIGDNIISIIVTMHNEIQELKEKIAEGTPGTKEEVQWIQETLSLEAESNLLQLKYNNISVNDFELLVNGVEYQMSNDFTLDKVSGTVLWTNEDLTLEENDEITAEYYLTETSELK